MPYEAKTDSKEFEVPSLDQGATLTQSAASEAADLTIRILSQDGGSAGSALTWGSESVLVYMIADLVAASHGRTAAETPGSMAAHFDGALQALVAAKRIQTAILEFLAFRPDDSIGAAILIHPAAATAFNQTMAQRALRLAEPGQIILSQEVAKCLQDLPGIELRAVPALTTGGTEHAGLSELIWTSAERLAGMRNRAPATPTVNVAPSFGATMIVNMPLGGPDGDADAPARSSLSADGFGASSKKSTAIDGLAHREGAFEETLAEFEEHQSFITPLKIAGAAIATVLVVVALMLFHPWSGSKPPLKVQPPETPTTGVSVTPEPPVVSVPQPPPAVQPAEELPAKPQPVVKPSSASKPPATVKDKPRRAEDAPIVGFEGNSTYDGMTQKDIPRLLQWARSDAGNGNYAKAAQEYRVILQLQPSNPDAREGLRKIQVAQGHN